MLFTNIRRRWRCFISRQCVKKRKSRKLKAQKLVICVIHHDWLFTNVSSICALRIFLLFLSRDHFNNQNWICDNKHVDILIENVIITFVFLLYNVLKFEWHRSSSWNMFDRMTWHNWEEKATFAYQKNDFLQNRTFCQSILQLKSDFSSHYLKLTIFVKNFLMLKTQQFVAD